MIYIIVAGILAVPGILLHIVTAPIVALLSLPALTLLVYRKKPGNERKSSHEAGGVPPKEKKRVVVTGGSSGIGRSIAVQAAKVGVSEVVVIARNVERLEATKADIEQVNPQTAVKVFSVDVSDANSIEKTAIEILESSTDEPPMTTHLFCCAGQSYPAYFQNLSSDIFEKYVRINQLGSIYTAQAFVTRMKAGSITFTSSICGQIGIFGFASYCPTKFALRGYAETLHMELSNSPIHIQVAYPPDTDTPGFMEENKIKPIETRLICEQGGLAQPERIASIMLEQALKKNPPFNVSFSLEGWVVSTITAGFAPVSTILEAVLQVSVTSLLRWISLFVLQDWYRIVRDCQSKAATNGPVNSKSD